MTDPGPRPLALDELRWHCDRACFEFATTDDIDPVEGVVGQDTAVDALRFGLEIDAPGQNVYVRGRRGTGRLTLVRRLVDEIRQHREARPDRVLAYHFDQANRPRLLTLATDTASAFADRMEQFAEWVSSDLPGLLQAEPLQQRIAEANQAAQQEMQSHQDLLEEDLEEAGLALVAARAGEQTRPLIVPRYEGEPAPPDRLQELQEADAIDEAWLEERRERIQEYQPALRELGAQAARIRRATQQRVQEILREVIREHVDATTAPIREAHDDDDVQAWLDEVTDDLVSHGPRLRDQDPRLTRRYRVNVLVTHDAADPAPMVVDNAPSASGLVGTIDAALLPDGTPIADHLSIRAGSLLQADGGYLILQATDLVQAPGAWRALVRTLRAGFVEWEAPHRQGMGPLLKPDPVPVDIKVILIGPPELYALLDDNDPEFGHLFKVLADFETTLPRNTQGILMYAAVLARLSRDEGLLPFEPSAVGALAEHGARIAAREGKLTARFGRLADIAREADFVARKQDDARITDAHVRETVRRTKERAGLPGRHFQEAVEQGTLRIEVDGHAVGQVNGLAVLHAGPLTYGFPTRISATVGPGTGGTVNIEGEARLSGAIHTKGFHILLGLLRTLLPTDHPLAFDASIAFEQSYGGIDGDSASGAEICCLLSALTDLPIRQDLAMTGAVDQVGNVLPIGAVNEKVEGFHDVCRAVGFTGEQGVLIPEANVGALVLREDVVASCERGDFHVYAVSDIHEALAVFLDRPAGRLDDDGTYPAESVLGLAMERLAELWEMAAPQRRPR